MVVNDDELQVHLHCGTVLDFEGLQLETEGLRGRDLSTLESSADWFAEQRRILASLEGASQQRRNYESKKMRGEDAQSLLRDAAASAAPVVSGSGGTARAAQVGAAKRRACEESQLREAREATDTV